METPQFESLYVRLGRIAQALERIADALDDVVPIVVQVAREKRP